MVREAQLAALVALLSLSIGCGASSPREADIYHDPLLRPGVVPAGGADGELLARLAHLDGAETLDVSGRTFSVDAPYFAASGRRCRAVRAGVDARLACESDDGWVFVPQVLPDVPGPVGTSEPAAEPSPP